MICEPAKTFVDILMSPHWDQDFNNVLSGVSLAFDIS
jgi:hypothetical protein